MTEVGVSCQTFLLEAAAAQEVPPRLSAFGSFFPLVPPHESCKYTQVSELVTLQNKEGFFNQVKLTAHVNQRLLGLR